MKFPSYLPPFEYSVELDADQAKAIEQIWNLALRQTRPCESKCELLDGFSFIFFQKSDGEILSGSTALFPDPQSVPGQLTSLYGCLESLAIHSAEKPGESAFGRWKQRWRVRRIKRKICTIIRWYRQRELIE
jgi:hypothetical protein